MKSQWVKLSEIKENPSNPRVINDERFKKLVKSIKDFPKMLELRPLVVDSSMFVLGGNMRLRACKTLDLATVPVIFARDLTLGEQKEFIVKDNIGYGEWDFLKLQEEWDIPQLEDWGLEMPAVEIAIAPEVEEDSFESCDSTESIQTDIVEGDLILIGRHRLLCGDSTNPQHIDRLLAGAAPEIMVTDPPYGVEYDPEWRNNRSVGSAPSRALGKVKNDNRVGWSDVFSLAPSRVAYVYHAGKHTAGAFKNLEDSQFEIRAQIIWVKNHFAISQGNYHWKHEPCWYAVKKGATANWCGDRKQTTIWEIDKPQKSDTGHSTQKPLECMVRPIRNHRGDVYDPFLGSGTTMVASHQLGRTCYGIEIHPKYCQIIIDRMKKLDPGLDVVINP